MRTKELKFNDSNFKKIYDERRALIEGNKDDPESGIPSFWLHAMLKCDTLKNIIQYHDAPILKHLQDISIVHKKNKPSFEIAFQFSENDFFENK